MVAAGCAGAAIGNTRVARHRAHNAADLGALAGAMRIVYGESDACARAARFVVANGGRITGCSVAGWEIVVRVEVEVQPLPGLVRHAQAVARAGPVYALPTAVSPTAGLPAADLPAKAWRTTSRTWIAPGL
jgi:secretion/DNA translocation related TadE-like protein